MLSVDEGGEKARSIWIVKIDQCAQLYIAAQSLAQEYLVVTKSITSAFGLRPIRAQFRLRRGFDLVECLIAEANHQPIERLFQRWLIYEQCEVMLFCVRRRSQR